jgi:hypothetical protein
MSRFGDLLGGKKAAPAPAPAPAPEPVVEPVVEEVLVTPEEKVLTEASPLNEMTKDELESLGRARGVELDKRHSKKRLIKELKNIGE